MKEINSCPLGRWKGSYGDIVSGFILKVIVQKYFQPHNYMVVLRVILAKRRKVVKDRCSGI